jgi:hypothetical protein
MTQIPRIQRSLDHNVQGFVLHHGEHTYILGSIYFWREASILGPALKLHIWGHRFPIHPHFDLPYTNDDILIRRKIKYAGRPFILRYRSHTKNYRAGDLYLPFEDFKFQEQRSTEIKGYEQVTEYFYRSKIASQIKIPTKEVRSELPELIEKAKEALTIMLQKETIKKAALKEYDEAKSRYFSFDPMGKFLTQYNEVKEKLDGGRKVAA